LPATARNHTKAHRTEFNKRMGRWICGCGWKSEPIGTKRPRRLKARTDKRTESDKETSPTESLEGKHGGDRHPMVTYCVVCQYESETDFDVCPRCQSEGRAVLVVRKA
jgi:hypothetical protein